MISPRVAALKKSSTLKITALTKKMRKEGKDVVNFAAGEPDFDTPEFIKQEAKRAIDSGFTKYTPSTGMVELKEAIANKLRSENSLEVSAKNIIVTSGAKYAIFVGVFALVDQGDEVILPAPYWVSYPEIIKLAGGTLKVLEPSQGFKITAKDLDAAITPKTKLLIFNYPVNPSGVTYSQQELSEIAEVIDKKDIYVISDEIYEKLVYDGRKHVSFASLPNMAKRTITINGFSKAFSMTGWRLGYLCGDESIITDASKIIDHTTSCACSITQAAGVAALKDSKWVIQLQEKFAIRRDRMFSGLSQIPKIKLNKPEGTFYTFLDIRETGLKSFDFASRLLENHLVSCIPADAFGAEGFMRLSFATSLADIDKGIERIKAFVSKL